MHDFDLVDSADDIPAPADPEMAARGVERWIDAAAAAEPQAADSDSVETFARAAVGDPSARRYLDAVFGNSPFLGECCIKDPAFVRDLFNDGPDKAYEGTMASLAEIRKETLNRADLAKKLRIAKRRVALTTAFADIAGRWPLERITHALSDFADGALSVAACHVLRESAARGAFRLADEDDPEVGSGLVILGMGKLGARELNYSSDIDLIVLYDPERIDTDDADGLQNQFVRLTRDLVGLIDERTVDGYVFRTDLRLRPDSGVTPIALSVLAAETYYETLGQNWERAAMIKARPVAGDIEAGELFLGRLVPYVWRKNLDFAAIQDIHSIKRQINAHKGGTGMKALGHNIKLGRGGIREIEFFAQTQQLIWGGREPGLRSPVTIEAIRALAGFGQCAPAVADDLIAAYEFLRRVEHRLQMIDDEQTQVMPDNEAGFAHVSTFLGYDGSEAFKADLLAQLEMVEDHYGALFETAPSLGAEEEGTGNLVFTGGEPDPDTLLTLAAMGYANPGTVDATVRGWHHGRVRATRSARAREILTELMPVLLKAIAQTSDPDAAFVRFDAFVAGLPSGVQLFSMFQANPQLLDLVADIMGSAPKLADHLSRRPSVLDSVLTPDFFDPLPDAAAMKEDLVDRLGQARYFEDVLNISRRWTHDRRFQVGLQQLGDHIGAIEASTALSDIAETVIGGLYGPVEDEFAAQHGHVEGGGMAVLALGKLGSREMTMASDLDLIFIYDTAAGAETSDGAKPLPVATYFARLSQRLINALTVMTSEGGLYEVDMRLRPSGNSGPIASTLEGFIAYHAEQAWTWEHMALTRARIVAGRADLAGRVSAAIRDVLIQRRDADALLRDVAAMRRRLEREKGADCLWELKQLRGGIVDIEFIVQYLLLAHAHADPSILAPSVGAAIDRLGETGLLDKPTAERLAEALALWRALQGFLSLTIEEDMTPSRVAEMPDTLKADLVRIAAAKDFTDLERRIRMTAEQVHALFRRMIEEPAAALGDAEPGEPESSMSPS